MDPSREIQGTDTYDDNVDYENTSQGHHDARREPVPDDVQGSDTLHENAEYGDKGGVKEWISSKLHGGGKMEQQHEGHMLGDAHDSHGMVHTGSIKEPISEPTTDSGAAVRSVSGGPTHAFVITPLHPESEHERANKSQSL